MNEAPSWSPAGFVVRWLLSPILYGGRRRCAARRCGSIATGGDRFCPLHHDALLEVYGATEETRRLAGLRLSLLPRRIVDRLDEWVLSMMAAEDGSVSLVVDGYESDPYPAPRGIVTGP